jgi:hypothetical protein
MMKCREPIALVGLIAGLVLAANVRAESISPVQPMSAAQNSLAKLNVQSVLRADGYVVDRLVAVEADRPASDGITTQHRSVPDTPEAWLARMIDPTKNGLAMKQPELFAAWLDAVTEPRFMTALASIAVMPETYSHSISKLADPGTAKNWAEFADPRLYLRWMAAGVDPRFYQGIHDRMTHDGKMQRWGAYLGSRDSMTRAIDPYRGGAGRATSTSNGEAWKQLPARTFNGNPWLSNSLNYRY